MDITPLFVATMEAIAPVLTCAGIVAFTIAVIVMLIGMLIDAFTGKGLRIGMR